MVVYLVVSFLLMFCLGYIFSSIRMEKPKGKTLEELSDNELFMLQCKIFDEISRRGAELIDPFVEFGGKEDGT